MRTRVAHITRTRAWRRAAILLREQPSSASAPATFVRQQRKEDAGVVWLDNRSNRTVDRRASSARSTRRQKKNAVGGASYAQPPYTISLDAGRIALLPRHALLASALPQHTRLVAWELAFWTARSPLGKIIDERIAPYRAALASASVLGPSFRCSFCYSLHHCQSCHHVVACLIPPRRYVLSPISPSGNTWTKTVIISALLLAGGGGSMRARAWRVCMGMALGRGERKNRGGGRVAGES